MNEPPPKVGVYVDWQNVYKAARRAFNLEAMPNEFGNFSPYQLARLLASGNGRSEAADLVRLEVHRGLPSSSRDPTGYGANRRQAAAWVQENPEVVIPRLRPLRYPRDPSKPPVEKGIDVQLGISALEHVLTGLCHVAIVFSHDTDLLPVIEALVRLRGADCVETASWKSDTFFSRLRPRTGPRVFHHEITSDTFDRVSNPINYAYGGH